jgi:hypothetical protein
MKEIKCTESKKGKENLQRLPRSKGWRMGRLVVELRIIRMVQFLKLGSIISHGLSLPQEIRMVAPVRVVKIRIWIKSRAGEIGVHLLIRKIAELSPQWTITSTMIRIRAIGAWFMWVEIVRVVGWSGCPTTRRSMLCRKITIIIKIKINASLVPYSMQISHKRNKLTKKNKQ